MVTNISKDKIPPELLKYLEGKTVDFIIKNNLDYYEIIGFIMATIFSMYVVAAVSFSIIKTGLFSKIFNLTNTTVENYITFVIFFGILLVYAKFLHFLSTYFRDLFKPPVFFAGTDKNLIIYDNNKFLVLSWYHICPYALARLTGKHRGDIIFRLYNEERIFNEYDGTEVDIVSIKISETKYAEKLEKVIRKRIDMAQGE